MQSTLVQTLVVDTERAIANFQKLVEGLSVKLNKNGSDVASRIMPLLLNVFYAETEVGALAYDLWDHYKEVPKEDMEAYSDAIIILGNDLTNELILIGAYNTEGNCMYSFGNMLGNAALMHLKELTPTEYQLF